MEKLSELNILPFNEINTNVIDGSDVYKGSSEKELSTVKVKIRHTVMHPVFSSEAYLYLKDPNFRRN